MNRNRYRREGKVWRDCTAKYYGLLLVILLVLGQRELFSQQAAAAYPDSLRAELNVQEEVKVRVELLVQLVDYYLETETDSVLYYRDQLIKTIAQNEDAWLKAYAWSLLAESYRRKHDWPRADQVWEESLRQLAACAEAACTKLRRNVILDLNDAYQVQGLHRESIELLGEYITEEGTLKPSDRVTFLLRISESLNEVGDYDAALNNLNQGLQLSRELGNEDQEQEVLGVISVTYYYLHRFRKSIAFAKEGLAIARRIKSVSVECYMLYNIGDTYLVLAEVDSARHYLSLLKEVAQKHKYDDYYGFAVGGLFLTAFEHGLPELGRCKAEAEAILQGDYVFDQLHVKRNIYHTLSRYYLQYGDHRLAEDYALQHLEHVSQYQADTTELITFALYELSAIQAAIGAYEAAWKSLERYHGMSMAMINRNQEDALARTAVEMDLAENEMARQKAEQATLLEKQSSAARTRFFLMLLLVVGIVAVVILWAYRRVAADRRVIKEKNLQIEESLAEKEVLLREIHHRVKNNLQIISSLLDKQARKSTDEAVRKLVREGQERIQSMALIHQNLYESEQLSGIDIRSYLRELGQNIQNSQALSTERVQLALNVTQEELDIDTAIPVGLILNELLTNCYKYAFEGRLEGRIQVDFKRVADQYRLYVSDNGVGFRPNKQRSNASLGLNLVNGLVRQLEGTIEWPVVEQGTLVAITF